MESAAPLNLSRAVSHSIDADTAARRPLSDVRLAGAAAAFDGTLRKAATIVPTNAEKSNAPLSGKEPEFFLKDDGLRDRPLTTASSTTPLPYRQARLRDRTGNRHRS